MLGRSLMYIKNNNGPRTEPCGTQEVIFLISDDSPFIKTYCFLLIRYDSNHL